MAAESTCQVNSSYVVRDASGRAMPFKLSGSQICSGELQLRKFYKHGEVKHDYFRAIQTADGNTLYIAKAGTKITGAAGKVNRPAPSHGQVLSPRPTAAEPDDERRSTPTNDANNFVRVRPGFNIRYRPEETPGIENVHSRTSAKQSQVEILRRTDGAIHGYGDYIKVKMDDEYYWLHKSALVDPPQWPATTEESVTEVARQGHQLGPIPSAASKDADEQKEIPSNLTPAHIKPGYNIRFRPKYTEGAGNIFGSTTTMREGIQILDEPPQNNYYKVRYEGRIYWLHAGAFADEPIEEPKPGTRVAHERDWARTSVSTVLKTAPDANAFSGSILGSGARMAIVDTTKKKGVAWHRVVPFDCDKMEAYASADPQLSPENPCDRPYWIESSNIERTSAPSGEEIMARPRANSKTEASYCDSCSVPSFEDLVDQIAFTEKANEAASEGADELLRKYAAAKASFPYPYRGGSKQAWAQHAKAKFVEHLIDRMGEKDASLAIMALTAWGEARGAQSEKRWSNIAEMAMVATVIDNRAQQKASSYQLDVPTALHTTLLHRTSLDGKRIRAALASVRTKRGYTPFGQFSVWNPGDVNLPLLMLESPTSRSMQRAFIAVKLLDSGKIKPVGELANNRTRHYYSPNPKKPSAKPRWASTGRRIKAELKTPKGVVTIRSHRVYTEVR